MNYRHRLNPFTPLQRAARQGDTKTMHMLLNNGAQVDIKNDNQQTPLNIAREIGSPETVKTLLSYAADPIMADQGGETSKGQAKILLENGLTQTIKRFFRRQSELKRQGIPYAPTISSLREIISYEQLLQSPGNR